MEALDLARWQFGITTVYHFIFVPLTIGLAPLVAIMQTAWVRTGNERWLRLTKFFGKLFLINFALGVVTGIVQEFQFGMNWSEYSRFVGDVFGAPLAMEALAAFFVESTFLGLWIFGWDRLSKRVHLACIWAVAIAVNLSAFFILAANSWMQHPVGARYNPETGRAEMESIWAILANNTLWAAFPHAVAAAFLTAGTFVAGIAAWWMVRLARTKRPESVELARNVYRPAVILGTVVMLAAGAGVALTGDAQGKLMFEQQPGKMASAEALCEGEEAANFSILTIGDLSNSCEGVRHILEVPGPVQLPRHRQASPARTATCPASTTCRSSTPSGSATRTTPANPISYTPEPRRHLLELPAHDRVRRRLRAARAGRPLVHPRRPRQRQPLARPHSDRRDPHAVPRLVVRLDLHRDGAPALGSRPQPHGDRPDPAAHYARRLHGGQPRHDAHLDDRVHPALRACSA